MNFFYIPITADDVREIHDTLEQTSPGLKGINDPGKVDAIIDRIATLAAYDQLPTIYHVAAAHLVAVAKAHAFRDLNKRTAFAAMTLFMSENGMQIPPNRPALEDLTVKAATGEYDINDVAEALKDLTDR